MEVEKKVSKGRFFQLFDWNRKSRKKKLFSISERSEEGSKGEKKDDEDLPPIEGDGPDRDSHAPNGGDLSCNSSVTEGEGNRHRTPNLIATLMGLDSLSSHELNLNPTSTSQSIQNECDQKSISEFHKNCSSAYGFSEKVLVAEPKNFQVEILPSKSVKYAPATQSKFLSAIKNPSFRPSKSGQNLMEEASNILDHRCREHVPGKISSPRTSSTLVNVQNFTTGDLANQRTRKIREASRSPLGYTASKSFGGQTMNEKDALDFLYPTVLEKNGSIFLENKEKSATFSAQFDGNIKKPGLKWSPSDLHFHKECDDRRFNQPSKTDPCVQKPNQKRSSISTSRVFKQNNKKQNGAISREISSKSLSSKLYARNIKCEMSSIQQKQNSKHRDKKGLQVASQSKNAKLSSSTNDFSQGKQLGVHHSKKVDTIVVQSKWKEYIKKSSVDIVSFTFHSPLKKPMPLARQSCDMDHFSLEHHDRTRALDMSNGNVSPDVLNVTHGDTLAILLEQKFKELTSLIGSSSLGSLQSGSLHSGLISTLSHACKNERCVECLGSCLMKEQYLKVSNEALALEDEDLYSQYSSQRSNFGASYSTQFYCPSDYRDFGSDIHEIETNASFDSAFSASSMTQDAKSSTKTQTKLERQEQEYVEEILSGSNFMFKDVSLGISSEIIDPQEFYNLEKSKVWSLETEGNNEEYKLWRKLLFDCVNESLNLICGQYIQAGYRRWAKGVDLMLGKNNFIKKVCGEISRWKNMETFMIDELVQRETYRQSEWWVDFEKEKFVVGEDIEEEIICSLIEEYIF